MASETTTTMNGNIPLEVSLAPQVEHKLEEENEVEKRKQKRRNKNPLLLCKLIVDYPKIAFALTLFGHLLLSGMNGILALTGYDIIPVEFEDFPHNLRETDVLRRHWGWTFRNRRDNKILRRLTINDTLNVNPIRGGIGDTLQIIYQSKSGNIFNKEALQTIAQIEDKLFKMEVFQSKYCQWDINNNCTAPESILRYFDGTYRHINPIFYDPEFNNITGVLYEAEHNPHTNSDFQYFLARDAQVTKSLVKSHVTRTSFVVGWPLPGNKSEDDKWYEVGMYLADEMGGEMDNMRENLPPDMNMYYFSYRLLLAAGPRAAFMDMGLAFGSLLFIFAFIWFQTKSFWVTSWSLFSIASCFFITNLFYRTVLGYRYFGYFHIIVIFIILGIGADDIFVFFNTWKSTEGEHYPSLAHRLSDSYRRAAVTMFVTSLTTMAAFLVSGLSPILPIKSFGVFAGLLVAVNYISVIVFFPTVVIMYHNQFESCHYSCCKGKKDTKRKSDKPLIVKFFSGPFYRFITHKIIRWILIILFLGITIFFGWAVSRLRAQAEQIYRRGSNMGESWFMLFGTTFRPIDSEYVPVFITWGLGEQNISTCEFSVSRCEGFSAFDEGFDMNLPNVQMAVKQFCQRLRYGLAENELEKLKIRRDPFSKQLQVDCFIENLENHMMKEADHLRNTHGITIDLSIPYTATNMIPFMEAYDPLLYNTTALSKTFHRYFEVAVGHWLTNGYSMLSTPDYYNFFNYIGEVIDPPHTKLVNFVPPNIPLRQVGFEYGTKLRYVTVMVNLSISYLGLGYTDGIPIYNAWEDFTQTEFKQMPYQLKRGFQTNSYIWHWLFVQKSLVDNAIQGIVIGIVIAWPVLVFSTGNIIIGTFATLVICIITVCVVGVIPLAGWSLGVLSSLNLCLVVGLSVDYVVHLAEGYHMSEHKDRLGRVHDMLSHVGISVVSGAITTLGAAFFMFFAQMQFFLQFGAFMFSCIGSSLVFSLGFFSTVLALCGPQNETGSIYPFFRWIYFRVIGRSKEDVTCTNCDGSGFWSNENPKFEADTTVLSNNVIKNITQNGITNLAFVEHSTKL